MTTYEHEPESPLAGGFDRRRLLLGGGAAAAALATAPVLGKPDLVGAKKPREIWGPRVPTEGLPELYAPQEVPSRTVVPGGIDYLGLHSTDIFEIPRFDAGIFEVDFNGMFKVVRSHPTTKSWTTFSVRVNITELKLHGSHPVLGDITVRLNKDFVSVGEIFPAKPRKATLESGELENPDAACRIATAVTFEVSKLGVTLFNKEPILLMNNHVRSIPPVDDPSGEALLYKLPLFDKADADGLPFAYLTSLKYGADHYLTRPQVKAIMES